MTDPKIIEIMARGIYLDPEYGGKPNLEWYEVDRTICLSHAQFAANALRDAGYAIVSQEELDGLRSNRT